jgi:hypothetical protein
MPNVAQVILPEGSVSRYDRGNFGDTHSGLQIDGTLKLDSDVADLDFDNSLTGGGRLEQVSDQTLTLSVANEGFSGTVDAGSGTVKVTDANALGTAPVVEGNGGTLEFAISGQNGEPAPKLASLITRGTLNIASDVHTIGDQTHDAKLILATGEVGGTGYDPITSDGETFIVQQDAEGNDKVYRHVRGVAGEKLFVHEVIVAEPVTDEDAAEGDGDAPQPQPQPETEPEAGTQTEILRPLYTLSESGEIVADTAGEAERVVAVREPQTQEPATDAEENGEGGEAQEPAQSLAQNLAELEDLGQTLRRYVFDDTQDKYLRLEPIEFTTEDADMAFNGGISGGGNAKSTKRSVLIDAGTATVTVAGQVGQDVRAAQAMDADLREGESRIAWSAFDRDNENVYRFEVVGEQINLNGDVTTFEEQIYRGAVQVGSVQGEAGGDGTERNPMRLLVSVDPAVRFLNTIDDSVVGGGTHSLATYALSTINEGTPGFVRPEIAFEGSVGGTNPLLNFTAETGVQDTQSRVANIRERDIRTDQARFPGLVEFGENVEFIQTSGDQIVYGWDINFDGDTVRKGDGERIYNTGQVLNEDGIPTPRGLGGEGNPPAPGALTPPGLDFAASAREEAAAGINYELELARAALNRLRGVSAADSPLEAPGAGPTGLLSAQVQVGAIASVGDADQAGSGADVCLNEDDENCEEQ